MRGLAARRNLNRSSSDGPFLSGGAMRSVPPSAKPVEPSSSSTSRPSSTVNDEDLELCASEHTCSRVPSEDPPPTRPCAPSHSREAVDLSAVSRSLEISSALSRSVTTRSALSWTALRVVGPTLRVASLNLGGRNTNPFEFVVEGDASPIAEQARLLRRCAQDAMHDNLLGPAKLPPCEQALIDQILAELYRDCPESPGLSFIEELLKQDTWSLVYSMVRKREPSLFNALNLPSLIIGRPSVFEDPESCRHFTSAISYLEAWLMWCQKMKEDGPFWLQDAPKKAAKRNLDAATACAGLLVFDVMCLCAARSMAEGFSDTSSHEVTYIPFRELAVLAEEMPASNFGGKHKAAHVFTQKTHLHALFAQEARHLMCNNSIAADFLPPFHASDKFTKVLLRIGVFSNPVNLSEQVHHRLLNILDSKYSDRPEGVKKALRTSAARVAVVKCTLPREQGGCTVCFISAHCAKSEATADFLESLRVALADFGAEFFIAGLDTNVEWDAVEAFQARLREMGFDGVPQPGADQVTVAKQRTMFQTQVEKAGILDVSHKDYLLSWSARTSLASVGAESQVRGETVYKPDLCTGFGIQRQSRRCVRLPTSEWPFDHCGVYTTFAPPASRTRCSMVHRFCQRAKRGWRAKSLAIVALPIVLTLLAPMGSQCRPSPFGPRGKWVYTPFRSDMRYGVCEKVWPCGEGWTEVEGDLYRGMCYRTTPKRQSYLETEAFCRYHGGDLVTIEDAKENAVATNFCPEDEWCWIGPQTDAYENVWLQASPLLKLLEDDGDTKLLMLQNMDEEVCDCNVFMELLVQAKCLRISESICVPVAYGPFIALGSTLTVSVVLATRRRPASLHSRAITVLITISVLLNLCGYIFFTYGSCYSSSLQASLATFHLVFYVLYIGSYLRTLMLLSLVLKMVSAIVKTLALKFIWCGFLVATIGCTIFLRPMRRSVNEVHNLQQDLKASWLLLATFLGTTSLLGIFMFMIGRRILRAWKAAQGEAHIGGLTDSAAHLEKIAVEARWQFVSVLLRGFSTLVMTLVLTITIILQGTGYSTSAQMTVVVRLVLLLAITVDSMTNEAALHILAFCVTDSSFRRLGAMARDRAIREAREVEHHAVARTVLQAGPTPEQCVKRFAALEEYVVEQLQTDDASPCFHALQAQVQEEALRINHLMRAVCLRYMIMPMRYRYLVEVASQKAEGRQHVPARYEEVPGQDNSARSEAYFHWLRNEASGAEQVLFVEVQRALERFNAAVWPKDLGLPAEEYPFMVWPRQGPGSELRAQVPGARCATALRAKDVVTLGETLVHRAVEGNCRSCRRVVGRSRKVNGFVVAEASEGQPYIHVHLSGEPEPVMVPRSELRRPAQGGAGVFVPGSMKSEQRCRGKINVDYEGKVPFPPSASLLDVIRCQIIVDDPYAIAVLVAFLRRTMKVVRVKNRFAGDHVEEVNAQRLSSEFYTATAQLGGSRQHVNAMAMQLSAATTTISDAEWGEASSVASPVGGVCRESRGAMSTDYVKNYRDVMLNVEVIGPNKIPIIGEIQVMFGSMAILKKSEQKVYTVMRMQSAHEMQGIRVFSEEVPRMLEEPEDSFSAIFFGKGPSRSASRSGRRARSGSPNTRVRSRQTSGSPVGP
mmetsp:Transcript_89077/g.229853  ORF Transcript_89077/g.229853 Transcript_89077/m.229853 type:complete len:1621 (+) Transcript_89077:144-5006(+)